MERTSRATGASCQTLEVICHGHLRSTASHLSAHPSDAANRHRPIPRRRYAVFVVVVLALLLLIRPSASFYVDFADTIQWYQAGSGGRASDATNWNRYAYDNSVVNFAVADASVCSYAGGGWL